MFGVQVFDRESPLTNRRCRDVQSLFPPLRARVSRWDRMAYRASTSTTTACLGARMLHSTTRSRSPAAQRYPDAAQTQTPPSISFSLPGAEGWVLSAPLIGSPGFRVSPQDDVPGFNVGPQDDAPGFNLDENGVQQPETTWSDGMRPGSVMPQDLNAPQTPTPPPREEDPAPPASAAASRVALQARDHAAAAVVDRIRSAHRAAHRDQSLPSRRPRRPALAVLQRASAVGGHRYPLPRCHDAEHQSPTGGPASDANRLAPATEGRLAVCPRGWCPATDTVGQASRRLQLQPCERWRCWRAAGAATDAIAAISAGATDNSVGSNRPWAGDGPPWA